MPSTLDGRRAAALRRRFLGAAPFRHLVVDGFLDAALVRRLSRDMARPFSRRFLEGADGKSGIAICRDISTIGPGFAELDVLIGSPAFLAWLREVTAIPGLRRNPSGDCGGLFRFDHDSEMDVHLDSNDVDFHCAQTGHTRKINLLLYLARGWQARWGGLFEVYRRPELPAVKAFAPLFNRCILFEAHDDAWHGVTRVELPEGKRLQARLALIVNYYSTDKRGARPGAPHYNIWMPRPLPTHLVPGYKPALADVLEVSRLLMRRDSRLADLRRLEEACRAARAGRKLRSGASKPGDAEPFRALRDLPEGLFPGRTLAKADVAALKRRFSEKDRELRRLYGRQYAWVKELKAKAPELVPPGY